MKDKKLEEKFGEYFKGVNTPDNITDDAKKYAVRKRAVLPKIVKFASVAASFVLVFTAALIIILRGGITPPEKGGDSAVPPPALVTYGNGELEYREANAYAASDLELSLYFIRNLAVASNAGVNEMTAGYGADGLALVKADACLFNGLLRHDTKIFVEFTEENTVHEELEDYRHGVVYEYRGVTYRLTRTIAENGEPEQKLYFLYQGVKYYFNVTSADEYAHLRYLEMIVK